MNYDEKAAPEWRQRLETALTSERYVKEAEATARDLTYVTLSKLDEGTPIEKPYYNEAVEVREARTEYIKSTLTNFSSIFESMRQLGAEQLATSISQEASKKLRASELRGSPEDIAASLDTFGDLIDVANVGFPNKIRETLSELERGSRFGDLTGAVDIVLERAVEWAIENQEKDDPAFAKAGEDIGMLIGQKLCLQKIESNMEKLRLRIDSTSRGTVEDQTHSYFSGAKTVPLGY